VLRVLRAVAGQGSYNQPEGVTHLIDFKAAANNDAVQGIRLLVHPTQPAVVRGFLVHLPSEGEEVEFINGEVVPV